VAKIGVPVVSGAIGIAGGVLLGRTALQRHKKVLGIPMPTKIDLGSVTDEIGKAGKQFGKLADEVRKGTAEVRSAREKAEQIARVFTP
jgi:HAMP domain-containing protein